MNIKDNKNYDIVVVGGGISGISASYIASLNGLKTLLIEKNSYLGGLITGGLVIPSMKIEAENINQQFFNDLIKYARNENAQITYGDGNPGWFNPIKIKDIFKKMLSNANCDILFESQPLKYKKNDKIIEYIEIKDKKIYSKYYIDATGNGSFSKLLGCEFLKDTNIKQLSSLRFIVSNVNLEELSEFLLEIDKDRNVTTSYRIEGSIHLSTACTSSGNWALKPLFDKAVKDKILTKKDADYFQIFTVAGESDSVAFNCPRFKYSGQKSIDKAKESIKRLHNFCKIYLKGFENSYISQVADIVGKRENGRVKSKYIYSIDDIKSGRTFDNIALCSDYPIDIHSDKENESRLEKNGKYYLPVESLMSYDYDNLYIIGKCLGATFEAQAALRVQQSCASMGEAVAKDIVKKINS